MPAPPTWEKQRQARHKACHKARHTSSHTRRPQSPALSHPMPSLSPDSARLDDSRTHDESLLQVTQDFRIQIVQDSTISTSWVPRYPKISQARPPGFCKGIDIARSTARPSPSENRTFRFLDFGDFWVRSCRMLQYYIFRSLVKNVGTSVDNLRATFHFKILREYSCSIHTSTDRWHELIRTDRTQHDILWRCSISICTRIWGAPCKDFLPGYWCSKGILERCFQGASTLKDVIIQSMTNCEGKAEDLQVHRRIHKALREPPGPNAANKMNTKLYIKCSIKLHLVQPASGLTCWSTLVARLESSRASVKSTLVHCVEIRHLCAPKALHTVWPTWEIYREKNYGMETLSNRTRQGPGCSTKFSYSMFFHSDRLNWHLLLKILYFLDLLRCFFFWTFCFILSGSSRNTGLFASLKSKFSGFQWSVRIFQSHFESAARNEPDRLIKNHLIHEHTSETSVMSPFMLRSFSVQRQGSNSLLFMFSRWSGLTASIFAKKACSTSANSLARRDQQWKRNAQTGKTYARLQIEDMQNYAKLQLQHVTAMLGYTLLHKYRAAQGSVNHKDSKILYYTLYRYIYIYIYMCVYIYCILLHIMCVYVYIYIQYIYIPFRLSSPSCPGSLHKNCVQPVGCSLESKRHKTMPYAQRSGNLQMNLTSQIYPGVQQGGPGPRSY